MAERRSRLYELPHKIKDYKKNRRLVGAYVPRPITDELYLVALYRNTSVSHILQEQIEKLVNEQEPVRQLMRILANRAYQEWAKRRKNNEGKHPQWRDKSQIDRRKAEFIEEVRMRLRKRRISEHHINIIVDDFRSLMGEQIDS